MDKLGIKCVFVGRQSHSHEEKLNFFLTRGVHRLYFVVFILFGYIDNSMDAYKDGRVSNTLRWKSPLIQSFSGVRVSVLAV